MKNKEDNVKAVEASGKKRRYMQYNDRLAMETLLNAGHSVREVAELLEYSRVTIYREFKRGQYRHLNSDYTYTLKYSCNLGQQAFEYAQSGKGRPLKIGSDYQFAEYIENKIINDKYSPEAALASASNSGLFQTSICLATLYSYIDSGVFLNLTNKNLPVKPNKKKKYRRVRIQKRASAGTSIEKRPTDVDERTEYGHWEMDTVKGKQKKTKSCLLVLTERKTREEKIIKLENQGSACVVAALDKLETSLKDGFSKIFKSITVDNGVEFSDFENMQRSALQDDKRTSIYYCHAYSSWERGSNENNNKLIRRHAPKSFDLDKLSDDDVQHIEDWINHYPRKIFGYKCSAELADEELKLLFAG